MANIEDDGDVVVPPEVIGVIKQILKFDTGDETKNKIINVDHGENVDPAADVRDQTP